MQQPTLQNVRVRSTRDALSIFAAVAFEKLPLITRRLDIDERSRIAPGQCYIWEERSTLEASGLGMERWTDGFGWSPSRVRDDFLFYHQKESDQTNNTENASTPWAQILSHHPTQRVTDSERLIKQTYSVLVTLPADIARGAVRKWHMTAYYSATTLDGLRNVEDIPHVGGINIPEGWFKSARTTKARQRGESIAHAPLPMPFNQAVRYPTEQPDVGPVSHQRVVMSEPSRRSTGFPYQSFPTPPYPSRSYPPNPRTPFGGPLYPAMNPPAVPQMRGRPVATRSHSDPCNSFTWPRSSPSPTPSDRSLDSHESASSMGTDADTTKEGPRYNAGLIAGDRDQKLVPLKYLQNIAYPRREPTDEQFLRLFSAQSGLS